MRPFQGTIQEAWFSSLVTPLSSHCVAAQEGHLGSLEYRGICFIHLPIHLMAERPLSFDDFCSVSPKPLGRID